jgi:hypothetical protein
MSPKYDIGAGVDWPETLELGDRDPVAYPKDGLRGSSFPMHGNIAVAEGGTVCSVDLDAKALLALVDWLARSYDFIYTAMGAVPDPGYVEPKPDYIAQASAAMDRPVTPEAVALVRARLHHPNGIH